MSQLIDTIRTRFRERRVVVIGDVVADQFLHGTIARVSREAPVFILDHDETDTRAGGAANAAANVASLGGKPVLVGFIGNDLNGELLTQNLAGSNVDCSFLVSDDRIRTTTKVRVLAGQHHAPRQQVIRIDYADRGPVAEDLYAKLNERLSAACDGAEAIIVSDYNYGSARPDVVNVARRHSKESGIPLLIDSRFRLPEFPDATAATPNQEEVEQILGHDFSPESCAALRERLGYRALLVTRGNKGMTLYEDGAAPRYLEAIGSKEPIDVTGAGDTVIGAFALGLGSGLSFADAANVANHAGGIVVMKRGTATVTSDELIASLEGQPAGLSRVSGLAE
jgi:rfaE bifunctional protein kinase chain/domain